MAGEIYARGAVHIRGLEQALRDGIAYAEDAGDKRLAGQLGSALREIEALHKRLDRIAEPHVGGIRPLIGGGK